MSKLRTRPEEDHSDRGKLLLYVTGEAEREDDEIIARHLQQCWECAALAERFKQGIHTLIEYRNEVLYGPIAVPPPSARGLRERLEREGHGVGRSSFFVARFRSAEWRPLRVAASCALLAIGVAWLVMQPPKISAGELLRRATASEQDAGHAGKRWVHRKVRIRRGSQIRYWDSYGGLASTQPSSNGGEWKELLAGPMIWDDPLSAGSFGVWRAHLAGPRDVISDLDNSVTLTTTSDTGPIRSSSLTLRSSDWHPVAKRVTFDGQPEIEATELVYEVQGSPPSLARTGNLPEVRRIRNHETPALAATPAEADNTPAEIAARDVLFSLGVGLTGEEAGFNIASGPDGVHVEIATQSARRRDEIQGALSNIQGVRAHILGPLDHDPVLPGASAVAVPLPKPPAAAPQAAEPLLWDYLVDRMGSSRAAMDYSTQVLESGGRVRSLVAQAHELAIRFPPETCAALNRNARGRLEALANRMLIDLALAVREYDNVLAFAFGPEELRPASGVPDLAWQDRTGRLFELISQQDRLSTRLFARTDQNREPAMTPERAMQNFTELNRRIAGLAVVANDLRQVRRNIAPW
jgi:hypothetical protein